MERRGRFFINCKTKLTGRERPCYSRETSRVLSDSATGIVVSQTDRIISVIGTKDIVVVDTPDSLLVTTKDDAKKVKQIVEALRLSGRDDVL